MFTNPPIEDNGEPPALVTPPIVVDEFPTADAPPFPPAETLLVLPDECVPPVAVAPPLLVPPTDPGFVPASNAG
jgi:hypothetical protein